MVVDHRRVHIQTVLPKATLHLLRFIIVVSNDVITLHNSVDAHLVHPQLTLEVPLQRRPCFAMHETGTTNSEAGFARFVDKRLHADICNTFGVGRA